MGSSSLSVNNEKAREQNGASKSICWLSGKEGAWETTDSKGVGGVLLGDPFRPFLYLSKGAYAPFCSSDLVSVYKN